MLRPSHIVLTLIVLFTCGRASLSQQPVLDWAKSTGGSVNKEYCYALNADGEGNAYTVGAFYGTIDFDPARIRLH